MARISELLRSHRILVCMGSGGVGKTTTAAALAVRAAAKGERVLCLTIDPARRLANSLGLDHMTTESQRVPARLFASHQLPCEGELWAMMLDTKATFDSLVARYAATPAARDRILANRFYQYVSSSLAGTRDYMAMEKLYEVRQGDYDRIFVDTPPTSNAMDFLDAPQRLVEAIDSPAMRWFVESFDAEGKSSVGRLGRGAAVLLRGLARFTGGAFLEEVAQFVTGLNMLFGGFRERAKRVEEIIRSPEVAFVVVTSPRSAALHEALFLRKRLVQSQMLRHGFVVNGVHQSLRQQNDEEASDAQLEAALADIAPDGTNASDLLVALGQALEDHEALARADRAALERITVALPEGTAIAEVPAFAEEVHDLPKLWQVAEFICKEDAGHTVGAQKESHR